jgi:long-chain fatty acid transport protein
MLAALLLAALPTAHAAGYYTSDIGTRGMSRGGAYIAGNRDLSAQFYNPAALINLSGPQMYINYSIVDQSVEFTRVDLGEDGELLKTYDAVHNLAEPMQIPAIGMAHNLGMDKAMFALGMFPPFAPDMEFPEDGSQRYSLIDSLVWEVSAGPSVAYQPVPWLTVGGSLLWSLVRAEQGLKANVCNSLLPAADEPSSSCDHYAADQVDLRFDFEMMDKSTITGNIGLLIEPNDRLKIGMSFEPPMEVRGRGSLRAEFSENHWLTPFLKETKIQDQDVEVSLNMPLIGRLGVAVNPTKHWQVEVATVYERWQVTKEVRISDLTLQLEPMVSDEYQAFLGDDAPEMETILIEDDVVIPADYVNTFSYRVGTEYDIGDKGSLRGGAWYEQSAIPTRTQGINLIDGSKVGYGLGGTYNLGDRWAFDIGFAQVFIAEREIKNSAVRQLQIPVGLDLEKIINEEPIDAKLGQGDVIGNGTLSATTTMMSAGLTVYFGG